ncbi:MAG TPA: phage holin family protein, partial [Anaerolineae bacterium]|nr:phage holin family protein [Anaerolineae bacterium]
RVFVKILVYLVSLLAACGIDYALGFDAAAMFAVAILICFREATSAMENSAALGFPWPEAVRKRLSKLQEQIDGDNAD